MKRETLNVKRGSASELRPCLGQGASLGEEAVLADSGRAGQVTAGVGRVRRLAFLSILIEATFVVLAVQIIEFQAYPQTTSESRWGEVRETSRG